MKTKYISYYCAIGLVSVTLMFGACSLNHNSSDLTNISSQQGQDTSSLTLDPLSPNQFDWEYYLSDYDQSAIWEYYTHYSLPMDMRYGMPYTYMQHKYLDLFIDFFAQNGWLGVEHIQSPDDLPYVYPYNLDLADKRLFVETFINENNEFFETAAIGTSYEDEYCSRLEEAMNAELNTMAEVISLMQEAEQWAMDNDIAMNVRELIESPSIDIGGATYHKMEVLEYEENGTTMPHRQTDCEECDAYFAPSRNGQTDELTAQSSPAKIVRYNLHLLWDRKIRYRNYKHKCPNLALAQEQMAVWAEATGNAIYFTEIADNGWNRFSWGIGCNYHLCLSQTADENVGGSSYMGCVPWASMKINPTSSGYASVYLHELGHVLGLAHEMERYDRDAYVYINCDNIKPGYKYNFRKYSSIAATPYGEFDFNSIMMYAPNAFAIDPNEPVIIPINGETYQRSWHLSSGDIDNIKALYH